MQQITAWVDLTDKEIQECWHDTTKQGWIGFVRAVIAKFKSKNTPPVVPQGKPITNDQEAKQFMEARLWEFIDVAGVCPNVKPDERIWGHVMAYAPVVPQEPVAWMHVQGYYEEPSISPLTGDELGRSWEQYPLYAASPSVEAMRIETLEKAAHRCDELENPKDDLSAYSDGWIGGTFDCAAAIRKMK